MKWRGGRWYNLGDGYHARHDNARYGLGTKDEIHIYKGLDRDPNELNVDQLRKLEVGVLGPETKHGKSLDFSTLPDSIQGSLRELGLDILSRYISPEHPRWAAVSSGNNWINALGRAVKVFGVWGVIQGLDSFQMACAQGGASFQKDTGCN